MGYKNIIGLISGCWMCVSGLWALPEQIGDYRFGLGIVSGEKSEWLSEGNRDVRRTTRPLKHTKGFIVEVSLKENAGETNIYWSFSGISPEICKYNVYSVEGNAFTLYYGATENLHTIQGCVPPGSDIRLADAGQLASPPGFFRSGKVTDAPALAASLTLKPGEKYYFCFYVQNAVADYNYFMLEDLFQGKEIRRSDYEPAEPPVGLIASEYLPAPSGNGVYQVRDFGAKGDGITVDSYAINRAIEAISAQGGGTLYFPAGKYLSYSIRLKSHIRLYLDAGAEIIAAFPTLAEGYDHPEQNEHNRFQDFGHSHWRNSLLWAIGEEDIAIEGMGTIYGMGLSREESRIRGVANKAISLKECRNVILKDIRMYRCGHFALLATGVENMTIDNLLIDTNRDGLDIDCCRNVRISNCTVNSPYDDAIVLKASYGLGYFKDTENVTITNCFVSGYDWGSVLDGTYRKEEPQAPDQAFTCGRIKFGTESSGGFKNIAISNCVFERSRGLALEAVDGGSLEDVTISNITMRDVVNSPLFLRLGARMRSPEGTPAGKMRRILIDNINVYNADSRFASIISGIPGHLIEDVTISNVRIRYQGGFGKDAAALVPPENEKLYPEPMMFGIIPASVFFVRHASGIRFHNIDVDFEKDDFRPAFVLDDARDIRIREAEIALPAGVEMIELRNQSAVK